MRLVALSDTHNRHRELTVPAGDVVVHAGDAAVGGTWDELGDFFDWFQGLPHRVKVFVGGNHDGALEMPLYRERIPTSIIYLEGSGVTIAGWRFFGAPWRPRPLDKLARPGRHSGFGVPEANIAEKWAAIPNDTDVLITHVPPADILDMTMERGAPVHIGCPALRARVLGSPVGYNRTLRPRLHIFGHIHDWNDKVEFDGTTFANVSICDPSYAASRSPMILEVL